MHAVDLIEWVQTSEPWNDVFKGKFREFFEDAAFRAALKEVLVQSDEKLKIIGQTDFTDPVAIQNGLRAQGNARGLVEAVEMLCTLAGINEQQQQQKENE